MEIQKGPASALGTASAARQAHEAFAQAGSKGNSFAALLQATPASILPGPTVSTEGATQTASSSLSQVFTADEIELSVADQSANDDKLKQAFNDFVGQTFFTELIKSYRSTQNTTPYFDGGQAEKIFRGQLDQVLSDSLAKRSADKIAGPMFDQFQRSRVPTN